MARARNIKPGFFKNADLVELPVEARLLFIGLWTLADRAGRLEDRPKQIKMELFPADAVDVDACLEGLQRWGFVKRYDIDGRRLLQVVNFERHQNPHRDEKVSALPAPDGSIDEAPRKHGANTVQARCEDAAGSMPIGLNPDSLIPDSRILNPDALITEEGKAAPASEPTPAAAPPAPTPAPTPRAKAPECPEDVPAQVWADWLALRKAKKAPVTATVIASARAEAAKAGLTFEAFLVVWCARGSQGLEASWLKPHERGSPQQPTETAWQRSQRERVEEATGGLLSTRRHTKPVEFTDADCTPAAVPLALG